MVRVYHFSFDLNASEYLRKGGNMVIFIATISFDKENDMNGYADYIELVKPIVEKYDGKYVIRSEKITALSKEWSPDRVIIIEFKSRKQLEDCFSSVEYKKIASLRENSVTGRAVIVE